MKTGLPDSSLMELVWFKLACRPNWDQVWGQDRTRTHVQCGLQWISLFILPCPDPVILRQDISEAICAISMKEQDRAGKDRTKDPGTANRFYSSEQSPSFVASCQKLVLLPVQDGNTTPIYTYISIWLEECKVQQNNKYVMNFSTSQNLEISEKVSL